jgi:hypothetical protein
MVKVPHVCISLLALSLSCCASDNLATGVSTVYRGHYTKGFEINDFVLCGGSQRWWVTGDEMPLIKALTSPAGMVGGTIYAEVRGHLTRRGSFGHLGAYPHELVVERVLGTRPSSSKDCQ